MGEQKGWFSGGAKGADAALAAVSLGHAFTHWYPSTLFVILPYLAKDLGLSYGQVGFLMSWNYFTSFFINLPGGAIVDVLGKTRLLLGVALALSGIPYFFLGLSASFAVALAAVTFVGIGNNIWHPAAISFLAKQYPGRKGFAMAVHSMGANLGDSVAPIVVGVTLTFLTWRNVLMLNILPGLGMGLVLWFLLARAGTVRAEGKGKELSLREYGTALKAMLRERSILLLCALAGLRSMTQTGLFTFLPLYLADQLKFSPALVGTYLTIVQAAGIFGAPVAGAISDSRGRRPVLTAGLLLTSLLLVLLVALRLNFLFVGALACLGFFLFALRPVMQAWAMDVAPKEMGGTTVSALFGMQSLFSGFSPAICGFIADRFGILYSFYFLASTVFVANFLVYLIPDKRAEGEVVTAGG